jgi:CheY-like chemotaxis protein
MRKRAWAPIQVVVTAVDWKGARRITVLVDGLAQHSKVSVSPRTGEDPLGQLLGQQLGPLPPLQPFPVADCFGGGLNSALAKRLIGVIDDDASIRKALSALLRSQGFRVQTFDCAEAFLAHERSDPWHCLIVDLGLPGIGGFELHEQLVHSGLQVPVIFISALDDCNGALADQAAQQGARALLQKPFPMQQLLIAIDEI